PEQTSTRAGGWFYVWKARFSERPNPDISHRCRYRRFPNLLYRRFPNLRVPMPSRHSADLEVGDTAGLETCATTAAAAAQSWVCNIRFSACELEAFEPEEIRLLYRA